MRTTVILFFTLFSLVTFAQNYDFGKISKEELEEKYNPQDSSANATYLYKNRKTFFEYQQEKGFELITEIHERIKIYKQEGFNYATKEVNLYKSGNDDEEFSNLKAYTYNLVEGKIVDEKLTKDGIFESELNKYLNQMKFTMPNIKPGSVVEFKYRIKSPFISNIDEFVFQHDIPVVKLEATFEAPEYFKFKLNTKGFLFVSPNVEEKRDRLTFVSKTMDRGFGQVGTKTHSEEIEFKKKISKYNLTNIPALKEESFVNNINNYRSSVKYELSYTDFPNSPLKYYSTSWEDVVKTIYQNPNFGSELDKSGYYEKEIDAIVSTVSDPTQRVALILDFVKSKVNWNGYYGYYTNVGVRKAYKDQVGNAAEINLMLTSMLRYAGLSAFPVLVSTRQNGIPLFPTREGYNYIITYVRLAETIILLDATNKYSAPNVLPFRTLNWQGRVMAEHGGSQLIDLYPNEISKNSLSFMANLDENGNLNGKYRAVKTNHEALLYREENNNKNKKDFLDQLENKLGGIEISDFKVENETDLYKPIIESYNFVKENQVDVIGGKLYFSPMFFLKINENPFKLEKREFPVDFGYPTNTSYKIVIKIPEGYKVESFPEPLMFMMPDNLGSFKYNISHQENLIQLSVESQINQPIILSVYYDALKEYFSKIVEKEAEQIVLTKI
ncbi:DUF3857 domain-containing protein [Mariniflexile jejuense]|uniref:DUF3857 domain-containing protein n=1 Tax=Mariniflexile jejuense TaxID=1173582 RepID=A0ABW3JH54_9FLAO